MPTTGTERAAGARRATVIAAAALLWLVPFIVMASRRPPDLPQPPGLAPARVLADASLSETVGHSRERPSLLARLIIGRKAAVAWQAE